MINLGLGLGSGLGFGFGLEFGFGFGFGFGFELVVGGCLDLLSLPEFEASSPRPVLSSRSYTGRGWFKLGLRLAGVRI